MIFLCSFIFVYSHFKNNITATIQKAIFIQGSLILILLDPPLIMIMTTSTSAPLDREFFSRTSRGLTALYTLIDRRLDDEEENNDEDVRWVL